MDVNAQLVQCYNALRDPTGANVEQATAVLMQIYEKREAFGVVFRFLATCDENLRQSAVLGLGRCINFYLDEFKSSQDVINGVLELTVSPCEFTRRTALGYLKMLVESNNVKHMLTFALTVVERHIDVSLLIIAMLMPYGSPEEFDIRAINGIVEAALTLDSGNQYAAVCVMLACYPVLSEYEEPHPVDTVYLGKSVEYYLRAVAGDNVKIVEALTRLFEEFFARGEQNMDVESLVGVLLPHIGCANGHYVVDCLDALLQNQGEEIQNADLMAAIFQGYAAFATATCVLEDSFDMGTTGIFECYTPLLGEYGSLGADREKFIVNIWAFLSGKWALGSEYRFMTLSFIASAMRDCFDFFESKSDEIQGILIGALADVELVRSAAIHCIGEFYQLTQVGNRDAVASALISKFDPGLARESLEALASVFRASDTTDRLFDASLSWLFRVYNAADNVLLQQRVFGCILALTCRSTEGVRLKFNEIFAAIGSILSSPNDSLKPVVIDCLTYCFRTCPEQIAPHAPFVLKYITENMGVPECIDAFAVVCETFPGQAQGLIQPAMSVLVSHAEKEVDIFASGRPDFDDCEFGFQNELNLSRLSLRVACQLAYIYPPVLPVFFVKGVELIGKQVQSPTVACVSGAKFLARAIVASQLLEAGTKAEYGVEILRLLTALGKNSSDQEMAVSVFETMAYLYKSGVTPVIVDSLQPMLMSLRGELFFQRGTGGILPGAQPFFLEIMHALIDRVPTLDQFVAVIQPTMEQCARNGGDVKQFVDTVSGYLVERKGKA